MQVATLVIGCALVLGLASAGRCEMQLLGVGSQMDGEKVAVDPAAEVTPSATNLDERREKIRQWIDKNGITPRGRWTTLQGKESEMERDWDYDAVVLHHSGNNGEKDPEAILKKHITPSIWRKEVYSDIGYHFAIRPDGEILEARSLLFKGSHCRLNSQKIGVILMGDFMPNWWDFSIDEPTEAQLESLKKLTGALKELFPTVGSMKGHRDFIREVDKGWFSDDNECPGDVLYNKLPELRRSTGLE